MTHKKNKFWNFCISFIPGAGQMYQGFLKRGTSLMALFFGEICLANMVNIDWLLFATPVIWCFAFFDSINNNSLSDEEFNSLRDGYLFIDDDRIFKIARNRFRIPAAVLLILVGAYTLLENMLYMFINVFNIRVRWYIAEQVLGYFPRIIFALLVIAAGIYLIRGKRLQDYDED